MDCRYRYSGQCRWLAKQRLHAFIDLVDKNWLRSVDLRRPVKLYEAVAADSLGFVLDLARQMIRPWRDDEIAASLSDINWHKVANCHRRNEVLCSFFVALSRVRRELSPCDAK